jgi:hypothetical protein
MRLSNQVNHAGIWQLPTGGHRKNLNRFCAHSPNDQPVNNFMGNIAN